MQGTTERDMGLHNDLNSAHGSDEDQVRAVYAEFMNAWNRGSGTDLAAVFDEKGDLVAFDGTQLTGQAAIGEFHQELFDRWLKGSRLVGTVTGVRFLAPDVAVMHALGSTVMRGENKPSPERDSIQTLVVIRRPDGWRLNAFQNTRIRRMGQSFMTFLIWSLSDWLWRVLRLNASSPYATLRDKAA